jgi:glucokinase
MILAGDVGGTKCVLAIFTCEKGRPVVIREEVFPSSSYIDFSTVIREFLRESKVSVRRACFGVAGPVIDNRVETTNLVWVVDGNQIAREFGISSVTLLNDLEATAHGVLGLDESEIRFLNAGIPDPEGNRAVIAAGTGLGEAVLFWDGSSYRPSESEGGHADFAPRNPLEIRLLDFLLKRYSHVSYERILSGPGLVNIYEFLKETERGEEPPWLAERLKSQNPPSVISRAAIEEKVPLCVEALDLFASIYGAETGNLALKVLSTGGIYLGGGIAPKILSKLADGTFMKSFLDKGRFSSLMRRIPVGVILNEKTALLGAAGYACRDEGG